MSDEVAARIRAAIADHGPITFAEFMEQALYGSGGFYERPPVGAEGHFVTSPHVHPVFADLLRFAFRDMREALGEPEPFPIVEVGAGDGTLARQLLLGYEEADHLAVDYTAIEISAGARERLSRLPIRVAAEVGALDPIDRVCLFANEVLDNLPFRRVRRHGAGVREIRVGLEDDRFVETLVPCEDELDALAPSLAEGDDANVPTGALAFIDRLAASLRQGYVLLIDYRSGEASSAQEVHGYRDHRVLWNVLDEPGTTDITAGVDFEAVVDRARDRGLTPLGMVSQRDALLALGFDRWNQDAREAQIRLLADRSLEAAKVWDSRNRAALLVDPTGLGRLSWLVLATRSLPKPRWLERAMS